MIKENDNRVDSKRGFLETMALFTHLLQASLIQLGLIDDLDSHL